jgi:homoserine kinase type II
MNTQALLRRGFALMGSLHDALRTTPLPAAAAEAPLANHLHAAEAATRTRGGADRIRGWHDRELSRFADRAEEHIDVVAAAEEPLAAGQIWQIVHGDFWDNNVLFRQDEFVAVIDFDFMGRRARIDDLALAIYFWLLKPGHGLPDEHDQQFVAELVDAYDTGTTEPLSAIERMALPLAIARQPAWSVGRWVPYLDEENSRRHAREAMNEFAVAAKVLSEVDSWQTELSRSTD